MKNIENKIPKEIFKLINTISKSNKFTEEDKRYMIGFIISPYIQTKIENEISAFGEQIEKYI